MTVAILGFSALAFYITAAVAAVLGHIDIGLIAVIAAAGASLLGVTHE